MGQQISLAYTPKDELELIQLLLKKFDLWSIPKSFKIEEDIAKPLGGYLYIDQNIFFSSAVKTIAKYIKPIIEMNWETNKEIATDKFHLYSKEKFYLEWGCPRIDNGILYFGRFYINTGEFLKPEIKQLFSFIQRHIKKTFPYVIKSGKNSYYISNNMAQKIKSEKIRTHDPIAKNLNFKDK